MILNEDIIGWKVGFIILKGKNDSIYAKPVAIQLKIPKGAMATAEVFDTTLFPSIKDPEVNKRRCSEATVIGIYSLDLKQKYKKVIAHSYFRPSFIYYLGATVMPEYGYLDDDYIECARGIHFFNSYEAMKNYWECNFKHLGMVRRMGRKEGNEYCIGTYEYLIRFKTIDECCKIHLKL